VSLFGFKTPIPYPFGNERTGYLVKDLDAAVKAAVKAGADVVVAPFPDPIGRDAVVRWPGGVTMQLYWHTTKPNYAAFETVPDNRVYLSPQQADAFIKSFSKFSGGHVVSDNAKADGVLIGRPKDHVRVVHVSSVFGNIEIFVTDGHLPYPYGRELTGYAVHDLPKVLDQAKASGAEILVEPFSAEGVQSAMVKFPGGYIAEIHSSSH
jgi:predicted enzyme related to lactoylglutathione lyase